MSTEQGADAPADPFGVDVDTIKRLAKAANNGKRWVAVAKSVREEDANTLGGAPTAHEGGICNVLGFNGLTGTQWRGLKRTMDDCAKARAAHIAACDPSTVLAIVDANRRLREQVKRQSEDKDYLQRQGQQLREALRVMVDSMTDEHECWSSRCAGRKGHADGCPVPAAEAALRTDGEARDNGGDEVALTKAGTVPI